jgi:hypothetical protein
VGILSYRSGFFAACAVLVVALAALAMRRDLGAGTGAASPTATAITTLPVTSTPTTSAIDAGAPCTSELAACRAESWAIVARTIRADIEDRRAPDTVGEALAPSEPTGPEAQRRVRCDIAEQQAREHWTAHRADILASIKDIGRPAWSEGEVKKTTIQLGKELALSPREETRVASEYAALWAKQGAIFQSAISAEPPDWGGLLDIVRAFWRDEDAAIERALGAHARDEHRTSELRSRTAIMAVLAALAGRPFDEAIAW